MVACPQCAAMLFIDMEDVAHLSASSEGTSFGGTAVAPGPEPAAEPVAEFMPAAFEPEPESAPTDLDGFFSAGGVGDALPAPAFEPDFRPMEPEAPLAADFTSPSAEDPLDLNGFANSELSQAKDGPLVFKLLISGIDSKEMRESIREAMTDSRFGWDAAELMTRVSRGTLAIDGLSPVMATVLVNRLRRMSLRIEWEQHAVVQLEAPTEPSPADGGF